MSALNEPFGPSAAIQLCCPRCGASFESHDTTVQCADGHQFPIRQAIPRFVDESAYAEPFGTQWLRWSKTQIDTDLRDESARAFVAKTGVELHELRNTCVLEVGCGAGRFLRLCVAAGATAAGIDVTRAVEASAENITAAGTATLAQADLFAPPFAAGSFDFVYSLGVLHHTPDTYAALRAIAPLVRPGGRLSLWVYSREPGDRASAVMGYFYRVLTTRLPAGLLIRMCSIARPLYALQSRRGIFAHLLRLALPISLHPDPEWRVLDTFDFYAPQYRNRHTYDEVVMWFTELGFTDIQELGPHVAVTGLAPTSDAPSQ
jgi:SAM-dependent methyltransferase